MLVDLFPDTDSKLHTSRLVSSKIRLLLIICEHHCTYLYVLETRDSQTLIFKKHNFDTNCSSHVENPDVNGICMFSFLSLNYWYE